MYLINAMFVLVPGDSGLLQVEIFGVEKVFYFSDACACLCLRCVCAALQKTRSAYKSRGRIQYSAVLQRSNFTIVGATPKTDEGLEAETERDKERGEEKERENCTRSKTHYIVGARVLLWGWPPQRRSSVSALSIWKLIWSTRSQCRWKTKNSKTFSFIVS